MTGTALGTKHLESRTCCLWCACFKGFDFALALPCLCGSEYHLEDGCTGLAPETQFWVYFHLPVAVILLSLL